MTRQRSQRESIFDFVERAHSALNKLDYYAILGVARDAPNDDIRTSYYKLASRLHPDLHIDSASEEQRRRLTAVFSRVVEAYKVLTNGSRREQYDSGLASGKLRWDAARPKRRRVEDAVPDGPARKFFRLGLDALGANNGKAAVMNLKMALSMAPDNAAIKTELERARHLLEGTKGGE